MKNILNYIYQWWYLITSGFVSLVSDPAGTLCILVLIVATILAIMHRISDIAIAACFSALPLVLVISKHRSFTGSDIDNNADNTLPPKGQL